MNIDKIKEIFEDEIFVKSLFELETASQVQLALKERDIEISESEILSIRDMLTKIESGEITKQQLESMSDISESGEIPEEMLEHVAGGMAAFTMFVIFGAVTGAIGGGLGWGITDSIINRW